MGTITLTQISNGDAGDATVVDTNFDTIANEVNGNLDNANIKNAANISGSKLLDASVTAAKISGEAWSTWTANATGFSSLTNNISRYYQIGKTVFCYINFTGTSNTTTFTFTLPVAAKAADLISPMRAQDNGSLASTGLVSLTAGSAAATASYSLGGAGWTASGSKSLSGYFFYEAN